VTSPDLRNTGNRVTRGQLMRSRLCIVPTENSTTPLMSRVNHTSLQRHWRLLQIALLYCVCVVLAPAALADDAVITHPGNTNTKMSLASVRAIFSMRLNTWPDGTGVTVFVLPDRHPAHAHFSRTILKMLPYRLRREWDRLVFSGTGIAPVEVSSTAEMKQRVASTPGSIGYLDEGQLDESIHKLAVE